MKLETDMAMDTGIARAFSDIEEVERVYVSHDGDLVVVTSLIDKDDNEATYNSIYDRERGLIRDHRPLHFDFNVVARRGRPVEDIRRADPTAHVPFCTPENRRSQKSYN
jgi:hypothetical protein